MSTALSLFPNLAKYRYLIVELTKGEIKDRYAGQTLGALWAWLHPLFLMVLYAAIFNFIFALRFGGKIDLPRDYTSFVLSGLVPWLAVQDVLARSADTVVTHANLVKQMAFPLEVLPLKRTLGSFPILLTGTLFLCLYELFAFHALPWTVLLWPVYVFLLALFCSGLVYLFSTLGVFVRDLREVITVFTAANLFMMPILFVPNTVPKILELIFLANPFSYVVWPYQDMFFFGHIEHPAAWIVFAALSVGTFVLGLTLFHKLSADFGDEL